MQSGKFNVKGLMMLVGAVSLILSFFWLKNIEWPGSPSLHTLLEAIASVLAVIVATITLIRYYTQKERRFLFIGAGFVGTAFLDIYHTFVTSDWFVAHGALLNPTLTTWSWHASRVFLSLLMFLSWLVLRPKKNNSNVRQFSEISVIISACLVSVAFLVFFALAPLPLKYYSNLPFGRPQEFLSAAFFLLAFLGYFRSKSWIQDSFEYWLAFSLIIGFFTQSLYMSSSFQLNDTMYNMAHVLKIISYTFVLTGLLINVRQLFESAVTSTRQLSASNDSLQKEVGERRDAELRLKESASSLEERIRERTVEIEDSRLAALNMMEDANEAKKLAETSREELDKQAKKLARSNKELEQFAYVASHDLQEPLRTVGSFVQLLAQRYKGKLDGQADEYIQFAVEGVTRMRQLINDLLMFSRVETKGGEFVPADLELILGEVLSNLRASIEASQAKITHDQLPMIKADKLQLSQVFQNLIGNAIKFKGNKTPIIHIGAEKQNSDWLFSVKDNGIGFDPEFSDKVFIIFQRLHTREEYPGTGIGLSLCKKIIERHGGRIWVDSVPDKGSTFNFTVPENMGELNEYSSYEQTNRNSVG